MAIPVQFAYDPGMLPFLNRPALAHFALTRAWGGLEMLTVEYALRLTKLGHPGILFTLEDSPASAKARQSGHLEVVTFSKSQYFSARQSWQIHRILKSRAVKGVLVHHLRDLWSLRPALIGCSDVNVVGFAHMFLSGINKKDLLHRGLYSRLKCLVAMTEHQRRELLKCLPIDPERAIVLPNGIDIHRFSPDKRSDKARARIFGVQPGQKLIGVVGRLDPQKGQLEFLQSCKLLSSRFPHLRIAFVGKPNSDGHDYKDKLITFSEESGLKEKVQFVDHLDDVSEAMACLDLFVMPSYQESFGLVLVEAMASGVPVLATDAGGPPEILQHGQLGSLVPPKDIHAMAEKIEYMLSHWEEIRMRAELALSVARQKFDMEQVLNKIERLACET